MQPSDKLEFANHKLGPRFEEALVFAAQKHRGQSRKRTDVPYVAHLLSVSALVLEAGGDEDLAIAALLHDVVEDCGGAPVLDEVRRCFGARVASIVAGCTDNAGSAKPSWRARKEEYLRHLRLADEDVRLVSAADKLHNLRSVVAGYRQVGDAVFERFAGRRDGTLWYYRALAAEFRRGARNELMEDLDRALGELEELLARSEK
jgi:(p)ppGpp synthase/HD superfamily hydrolase